MSYRPPFAESFPSMNNNNNSNRKNRVDEEGWEHVAARNPFGNQRSSSSRYSRAEPVPTNTGSRWGQSALARPAPKPKTREEEFPSLGVARPKSTTPPSASVATETMAAATTLSMAERMKIKLAEEEEERIHREAEEVRRTMEDERDRARTLGFVPMYSIMQSRRAHSSFDPAEDHEDDIGAHDDYHGTYHDDHTADMDMEFDDYNY